MSICIRAWEDVLRVRRWWSAVSRRYIWLYAFIQFALHCVFGYVFFFKVGITFLKSRTRTRTRTSRDWSYFLSSSLYSVIALFWLHWSWNWCPALLSITDVVLSRLQYCIYYTGFVSPSFQLCCHKLDCIVEYRLLWRIWVYLCSWGLSSSAFNFCRQRWKREHQVLLSGDVPLICVSHHILARRLTWKLC